MRIIHSECWNVKDMKLDDLSWLGHKHEEAIAWLRARLEDAVQPHDILPGGKRKDFRSMFELLPIPNEADPDLYSPYSKLSATSTDIRRMEEVILIWLPLLAASTPMERRFKI